MIHDDVMKWKHFPRYWPFVRGIHRSPVNSPHKGQWRGALIFSLIWIWMSAWVNNREAGDLRRQHGHYDVIVMQKNLKITSWNGSILWITAHCEGNPWPSAESLHKGLAIQNFDIFFVVSLKNSWTTSLVTSDRCHGAHVTFMCRHKTEQWAKFHMWGPCDLKVGFIIHFH